MYFLGWLTSGFCHSPECSNPWEKDSDTLHSKIYSYKYWERSGAFVWLEICTVEKVGRGKKIKLNKHLHLNSSWYIMWVKKKDPSSKSLSWVATCIFFNQQDNDIFHFLNALYYPVSPSFYLRPTEYETGWKHKL